MGQPLSQPPLNTLGRDRDNLSGKRVGKRLIQDIGQASRQRGTAGGPVNNEHGRTTSFLL
jgi:hypothetical protein